jgi:hypothetical protein
MQQCILVDIDGTIALRGDRGPHDHDQAMEDGVNWAIVRLVECLRDDDLALLLVSGRDEKYRDITEFWLKAHRLFDYRAGLLMRARFDCRPDEDVKREIYEQDIKPHFDVLWVFDDRNKVVKMWRDLGLTCLQVADGDF